MSEGGQFAMMMALGAVGVAFIIVVLHPLVQALAERLRGGGTHGSADLEQRIERLEQVGLSTDQVMLGEHRLAELEERVDFAERLLARQPQRQAIGSEEVRP